MKKMTLSFVCEKNGNWYVDLPYWPGLHRNLQMVAGADDLLDRLADAAYGKLIDEVRAQKVPAVLERDADTDEMFEEDWKIRKEEFQHLSPEVLAEVKEEERRDFYYMMMDCGKEMQLSSIMESRRCKITIDAYIGRSFFDPAVKDDFILYVRNKWSLSGGAHYGRTSNPVLSGGGVKRKLPLKMWLCPVTLFVCHEYPQCIAVDPESVKIKLR